mgnify:CR=1 FL=1
METLLLQQLYDKFSYSEGKLLYRGGPRNQKGKEPGWVSGTGYLMVSVVILNKNKQLKAHRVIFALHHGYFPALIDHIDRNKLNNRIENLRASNHKMNALNSNLRKDSSSLFTGVSYKKDKKRWKAYIKEDYVQKHIGYFDTKEEAAVARAEYMKGKYE